MENPIETDAEPMRVLFESDPFCPKCGHNRDRSSVSSIDGSKDPAYGYHYCQMCRSQWREVEGK